MLTYKPIKDSSEYKQLVEQLSFLVDSELKKYENLDSKSDAHTAALAAPKLISLVNVIGYLRGQDNAFLEVRPQDVVEYQKDLYANEDSFEDRLGAILAKIASYDLHEIYNYRLDEYFIKARAL